MTDANDPLSIVRGCIGAWTSKRRIRMAEHFTVSDGQITRIRQIHDTAALLAAGFAQTSR